MIMLIRDYRSKRKILLATTFFFFEFVHCCQLELVVFIKLCCNLSVSCDFCTKCCLTVIPLERSRTCLSSKTSLLFIEKVSLVLGLFEENKITIASIVMHLIFA